VTTGRCRRPVTEHHRITLLFLPLSLYRLFAALSQIVFQCGNPQFCCLGSNYLNENTFFMGRTFHQHASNAGLWIIDQAEGLVFRACRSLPCEAPVIKKRSSLREQISQQAYSGICFDARAKSSILIGIHARRGGTILAHSEVGSGIIMRGDYSRLELKQGKKRISAC